MAKKKGKVALKVEELLPKPFELSDVIDITAEGENFDLTPKRAKEITKHVEMSSTQLTYTKTIDEQHFRDRLEAALEQELSLRNECTWPGCGKNLGENIVEADAHIRYHMMTQSDDPKLARAVWLDVEERLFPVGVASIHGGAVLPPEEREKLEKLRMERLRLNRTNI